MCLYPKLLENPRYKVNKKNKGIVPEMKDRRVGTVPVGCTKCMECRDKKGRDWSVRLQEELRVRRGTFVTLTFSNESIAELTEKLGIDNYYGYEMDNEIATLAVKRFNELWRWHNGRAPRHWFITELGGEIGKYGKETTENIHLHGIVFSEDRAMIKACWKQGFAFLGDYCTEQTVSYMMKYVNKCDLGHEYYKPKIFVSMGLGSSFLERSDAKRNRFVNIAGETKEDYVTRTGVKIALPDYYRGKLWSDDEREKLWLEKLDRKERWVDGSCISIADGDERYFKALNFARLKNKRLGYGDDEVNWEQRSYENQRRRFLLDKRIVNC